MQGKGDSSLSRIQPKAPQPNSDDCNPLQHVAFQMGIKGGICSPPDGDIYNRETAMQLGSRQSPKGQLGGTGRGGGGGGLVQKREHNKKWPLGAEAKVDRG